MERWVARMNIADFERLLQTETDPERLSRIERLLRKEREKLSKLQDAAIFSDISLPGRRPNGSNTTR